jgi:RNA polymerase sigma-70 factor, ECF subfamily
MFTCEQIPTRAFLYAVPFTMEIDNPRLTNGNMTQANEAALLRRARAGDRTAIEILFAQNNRSLRQTALRLLGNREDAEDALQEGMLAAYRNLRHFQGRSQFSTWLTRIVINAALMRRRSRRRHAAAVSFDECGAEEQVPLVDRFMDVGPSPEQIYAGYELSERLRENLEGLSPVLRRVFLLRAIAGLTAVEASKATGVSRNTLKAQLFRARQQLATQLDGVPLLVRRRGSACRSERQQLRVISRLGVAAD